MILIVLNRRIIKKAKSPIVIKNYLERKRKMNFTQALLTKEKSDFHYLHVRMNDHLAHYSQIKRAQLSQLNILIE